jgi:hypothetical protein
MALQTIPGRAIELGSDTEGDLAYYDGSKWTRLAKGTAGQLLATNSGATAPVWVASNRGKILQVVQTVVTAATATTTSTTMVDIAGLSRDILPSSTSSKILVTGHVCTGGTDAATTFFQICRGSTVIGQGDAFSNNTRCNASAFYHNQASTNTTSFEFLDEPGLDVNTTYKIRWSGDGSIRYLNRSVNTSGDSWRCRTVSLITLYEIGA